STPVPSFVSGIFPWPGGNLRVSEAQISTVLQDLSIVPETRRQTLYRGAVRPQAEGAAGMDDAAGWPLSAGISRAARQGRRLSGSVLHAGICRRGDAAADPPFQLRRRDHLFRHSRPSLPPRP